MSKEGKEEFFLRSLLSLFILYRIALFTGERDLARPGSNTFRFPLWMQPLKKLKPEEVLYALEQPQAEPLTVPQLLEAAGYQSEEHSALTDDGYILPLFRIPSAGPPVVLQHGLLDSAATWVMLGRESLPCVLRDQGYDVWLVNQRGVGNLRHLNYKGDDPRYWEWTFDELAKYDLPATVKYVLGVSGHPKVSYIGHSQGSMVAFAALSRDHHLASKIGAFAAIAPVANFAPLPDALTLPIPGPTPDSVLGLMRDVCAYMPSLCTKTTFWTHSRTHFTAPGCVYIPGICAEILCLAAGCRDSRDYRHETMTLVFAHYPEETSMRNLHHFAQCETRGTFASFDHGTQENMRRYGQETAPLYNISHLGAKVGIFYGDGDKLALPHRVEELLKVLPVHQVAAVHRYPGFGHADFLWGTQASRTAYPDIVRLLDSVHKVANKKR